MFYKFINEGKIEPFKGYIKVEKLIKANPPESEILNAGYKPLIELAPPEYNPETEFLNEKYQNGDTGITKIYEAVPYESAVNEV